MKLYSNRRVHLRPKTKFDDEGAYVVDDVLLFYLMVNSYDHVGTVI